jgi:hypothetical protein
VTVEFNTHLGATRILQFDSTIAPGSGLGHGRNQHFNELGIHLGALNPVTRSLQARL